MNSDGVLDHDDLREGDFGSFFHEIGLTRFEAQAKPGWNCATLDEAIVALDMVISNSPSLPSSFSRSPTAPL